MGKLNCWGSDLKHNVVNYDFFSSLFIRDFLFCITSNPSVIFNEKIDFQVKSSIFKRSLMCFEEISLVCKTSWFTLHSSFWVTRRIPFLIRLNLVFFFFVTSFSADFHKTAHKTKIFARNIKRARNRETIFFSYSCLWVTAFFSTLFLCSHLVLDLRFFL